MSVGEILAKLIGFPTICQSPNDDLIEYVYKYLTKLNFRVIKLPSEHSGRLSLLASIGPPTDNGIVFSAHSDVVPVKNQPWTSDPFQLTEKDGKLIGRGSSDMKGFLACMLVAATYASQRESELVDPLHLAISYDEEIGCVGVRSLLSHLQQTGFSARGCIIGEPTMMDLVTGHKGKMAVQVQCHGLSAHSSDPAKGCNAILLGCEVIREIEAIQAGMITSDLQDMSYEVTHSTAQVGVINGGIALNIVPDTCDLQFEMRLLAGDSGIKYVNHLKSRFKEILANEPKGSIDIRILNEYPGLNTPDAGFAASLKTSGKRSTRISFGTEGGLFQHYLNGIPVVVCGPGSIERAHKADEWITKEELDDGVEFLKNVIDQLLE